MPNLMNKIHSNAPLLIWLILSIMIIPTMYITYYEKIILLEWNLAMFSPTPIMFTLIMDPVGMMFSCTVLIISANVLSFSTIYMANDMFIKRFTLIVLLFILSMNMLIYIPHMMIMLLGWDGLGLVSFILVIYYQNNKSLAAGLITALSNRIGDALLLIAIAITMDQGHWLIINMMSSKSLIIQSMLILFTAMTKSAQMPFSSWLPAAMAAPTPVSALVHSSTLVTAGVFILIRFYPFLHSMKSFNSIILFFAVCTMLMAGLSATTECDMKKIIALSTLSQLGMMMTSLGFNLPGLTFFHMTTHAMFKALLFIGAGSLINIHFHSQDLRWMGSVATQMPITASCMTIANMALCGIPYMAGFYSKDLIIEMSMKSPFNIIMMFMVIFSVCLTSFYSMRFIMSTIMAPMQSIPWMMSMEYMNINKPMMILSTTAIVSGSMLMWINPISNNVSFMPIQLKMLALSAMLMSFILSFIMSSTKDMLFNIKNNINHYSSCMMWFLVPLSTQFMMKYPLMNAHLNLKTLDHGWLEFPQFMYNTILNYNSSMTLTYPKYTSHIMILCFMSFILMSVMM